MQLNSSNLNYYIEILKVHGIDPAKVVLSDEEEKRVEEIMSTYEQNLPRATAH